jgi:hypothetical protein
MDLARFSKMQKVEDEYKVSPDGDVYRATKWKHDGGAEVEVNIDQEPVRYHARVNREVTAVNLDQSGLVAFLSRFFGRR